MDDDPLLLAGLVAGLHGRFDVTTAESGPEALRLLAERGPFTVIVSDFAMPGMDGAQFLERAREALGAIAFAAAESDGRSLSYDEAIAQARAWLDEGS